MDGCGGDGPLVQTTGRQKKCLSALGLRFGSADSLFRPFIAKTFLDAMLNMLPHAFVSPIVAQSSAPTGGPGNMMLIVMVLMFVGMYFLTIAPQRKKEKEHKKMLSELQSGDEVLTAGGIYGVITNVKDDRFVVRIADGAKVEIAKGFVNTCVKKASSAS